MYLIQLVTDRYNSHTTRIIMGYKEKEDEAREYCQKKTKELEGTYNESMGCKYYEFRKIDLLTD